MTLNPTQNFRTLLTPSGRKVSVGEREERKEIKTPLIVDSPGLQKVGTAGIAGAGQTPFGWTNEI